MRVCPNNQNGYVINANARSCIEQAHIMMLFSIILSVTDCQDVCVLKSKKGFIKYCLQRL